MEDSGGDDDGHDDHDNPGEGGKGSSSSQVRKAQNRIAQREFRLRKQQYIRDLEARVEVLSGDKEERIELMTLLVRNLLKENKDLRNMVKNMAGFIGEGLGSCLPRLGLSADGLDAILTRSDTDTAYEAFVNLKASKEQLAAHPGMKYGATRRRASTTKRKRDDESSPTVEKEKEKDKGKGRATSENITGAKSRHGSATGTPTPLIPTISNEPTFPANFYSFNQPEDENYHYLFPDLDTLLAENDPAGYNAPPNLRPRPPPLPDDRERFDPRSFPSGGPNTGSGKGNGDGPLVGETREHGYAHHIMPTGLGGGGSPKAVYNNNGSSSNQNQSQCVGVGNSGTAIGSSSSGYLGFGPTPPTMLSNTGEFGIPLSSGSGPSSGIMNLPSSSSASSSDIGRSAENPISSLAGPRPAPSGIGSQGNYARGHPSVLSSDLSHTGPENPQTLREAVTAITNADNPLEGPGVTAAELAERRRQQDQLMRIIEEGDPADRKMETMQLITYHLNNFRMNHEYHLPPSLRPTVVQRTIPHEHAIDGIIFPSIRDRMILLRGRYDLVEVFRAMLSELELHGDDVLDHNNYEISERFIDNYSILIDDIVINISNKWRAQRGAPLLSMPDKETTNRQGAGNRIHAERPEAFGRQ
ncbi:hypothetical protein V865_003934 [Kwoniella europaea PYCC6329]|uniref:BZIP domain-containing protein n=1 Tax=Kwoniella europaea PYCC6329 TaxID=1423913 RepID=A0AAX4KHL0_9TREE